MPTGWKHDAHRASSDVDLDSGPFIAEEGHALRCYQRVWIGHFEEVAQAVVEIGFDRTRVRAGWRQDRRTPELAPGHLKRLHDPQAFGEPGQQCTVGLLLASQ